MITTRPYSLARLLAEHGFNVTVIFSDSVGGEDRDFEWLKTNVPGIRFEKCVSPEMRTFTYNAAKREASLASDKTCRKDTSVNGTGAIYACKEAESIENMSHRLLALGQKAAYFTQTPYFVDMVENGPLYGFDGIVELSRMMTDAFLNVKDLKKTLDIKGWGCESCI